eukprot:11781835-Alexandrium_andersonii.AAC.1
MTNWLDSARHHQKVWRKSLKNSQKCAGPAQQTTGALCGAIAAKEAQYSGVAHCPLCGGREH